MRLILLLSVLLVGLSACSQDAKNIVDANTLRVDIGGEITSLDPAIAEDGTSFRVANDLFAGLVDFDQTNQPIPGMASSWNISRDGKTYTFHLRDGLKFSDGTPITAEDFIYSWQRLVSPQTASAYGFLLKDVVNAKEILEGKSHADKLGVMSPDSHTFVVHLTHPNSAFLAYITTPSAFVVPQHIISKYGESWTQVGNIVTSGSYMLKEHVRNGYLLAEKNPNFYDSKNVAIQEVKYFPYTDTNSSLASYKTGSLDTTWQNVPIDQFQDLKDEYGNQLHVWQWERTDYLHINMKSPKFANNPKLRQALSMAVDRNVLTNDVLKSGQVPLYSIVTPTIENGKYAGSKYAWESMTRAEQIAMARRLYQEAGYSAESPLTITLKHRNNDMYKKVCLAVAAMWSEVLGVKVQVQNQEWKVLVQALHSGDYEIAEKGGWGADYNSVTTYLPLYMCNDNNNNTYYCNPKYNALVSSGDMAVNPKLQEKLYKEAIEVALNDYPVIPLYEPAHQRLVNPRVQNYRPEHNYLDNIQSKWSSIKQ